MPNSKAIDHDRRATERREGWQLDKKVPVALILILVLQFVGVVIWGAKMDSQAALTVARVSGLEAWKEIQGGTQTKTESRLAVIEERLGEQSETLHHIDDRLEKMLAPPHNSK